MRYLIKGMLNVIERSATALLAIGLALIILFAVIVMVPLQECPRCRGCGIEHEDASMMITFGAVDLCNCCAGDGAVPVAKAWSYLEDREWLPMGDAPICPHRSIPR